MISKGDDYPIHQTPEPVAFSGTDRNFYDRYFFNGYSRDGEHFFALAMGIYPHIDIIDASFAVIHEGVQHNLRASRVLGAERMDTRVGPISVEVIEPLKKLMVRVADNEYGIGAELVFDARTSPVEEPRFIHRIGPQTVFDYTRMTQNGSYSGVVEVKGKKIEVRNDRFLGTRDRSWGIRPIGPQDTRKTGVTPIHQFYWIWAPLNFDDCGVFYALNENADGTAWARSARIAREGAVKEAVEFSSRIDFKSGTRHAARAVIKMRFDDGEEACIELAPRYNFYMSGIGYLHPEWNHGTFKGNNSLMYDTIDLASINENAPIHLHVQALCEATMTDKEGKKSEGMGVLEQLILGPHAPSGFKSLIDPAP